MGGPRACGGWVIVSHAGGPLGCSLGTRCRRMSILWMRKPGSEISWLAKVGGQVCGRARIPIQTSEFQCDIWVLSTKADMPSKGFLLIEDFRKHQVKDPMFITLKHGELRALCRDNCVSAYRLSKFVVIYKWWIATNLFTHVESSYCFNNQPKTGIQ